MRLTDYYEQISRARTDHYQETGWLMRTLVHDPNERHRQARVLRELSGSTSVADLGCGFGAYLLEGLDPQRVRRVFINDITAGMVQTLEEVLRERFPDIEIGSYEGSVLDLPTETAGTYELAMCLGVVNHLKDAELRILLHKMATLAEERILLYYAHEGFLLAKTVGISFRSRGIHYEYHHRERVREHLEAEGFRLHDSSYAFALPILSPLVIQEYRRGAS